MGKKLLLLPVIILFCVQLSAQYEKNKIYSGISFERGLRYYNASYGIQPAVGIAISKNSLFGIYGDHTRYKKYVFFGNETFSKSYGLGVFYNYSRYFSKKSKFGWSVQGSLGFNRNSVYSKSTGSTFLLNNKYNEIEFAFRPGIFYKPSQKIMVWANFGGFASQGRRLPTENFRLDFLDAARVGMYINLGNNKKRK
jgi:hypothetical protein